MVGSRKSEMSKGGRVNPAEIELVTVLTLRT